MEGRRASGRGACRGLVGQMPIAEPSCSSGSGPMKRLATNGHAAVLEGAIDVGPVDAYWHLLTQLHHPDLAARVRVLESTVTAPMPAFVANPSVSPEAVDRLATSFQSARDRAWFRPIAAELLIDGFTPVRNINAFSIIRARARQAEEAGYPAPA